MLKDHNHDLVQQLSEVSDTLWRLDDYIKNSKGCDHCSNMWDELRKDYEKHSTFLTNEIARHVKEDRFE